MDIWVSGFLALLIDAAMNILVQIFESTFFFVCLLLYRVYLEVKLLGHMVMPMFPLLLETARRFTRAAALPCIPPAV